MNQPATIKDIKNYPQFYLFPILNHPSNFGMNIEQTFSGEYVLIVFTFVSTEMSYHHCINRMKQKNRNTHSTQLRTVKRKANIKFE